MSESKPNRTVTLAAPEKRNPSMQFVGYIMSSGVTLLPKLVERLSTTSQRS